ncbi:family 78 glycoside hydrolase catalytic domain [Actomonas aquatica]|uniref:alpha-L-rhamnosidase n=1 Tax=Actomonas aquatica TaxID=2866162 RepID=A0ABZ1C954_9BACT|nr:family 78 glycoside hydrolase catalytic domain [Opitutus sp. WL0086]WRQ88229.1 family 78 glycoside hydrolase catalytic domain [Opitutus sp. WL0086]
MSDLTVSRLRCEYLVDPLGIDETAPRLSWELASARRGARQVAYQVRVASTVDRLRQDRCDRWDSGRVESAQTSHISYAGVELLSREVCVWDVEVWDETGASVRSEPARWTMGLLGACDWEAQWIAADPAIITRDPEAVAPTLLDPGTPGCFRREFELPGQVARATVYASARGLIALRVNGQAVSEDLFAPEWTDYQQRIHYRAYDVTALLQSGRNCLAATLGDGWWTGYVGWQEQRGRYGSLENSFMAQLEVELTDRSRVIVCTDGRWSCDTGAIRQSDFQMGEICDARRTQSGWDAPAFDAHSWLSAVEVAAPRVALVAQRSEPVRITETIAPSTHTEIAPGVHLYDLGQNISGWARLTVEAPAGTRVQLRFGERLSPDGTLYVENLRRAKATDVYVCRGDGVEVWEPTFTFHGFQYVELTGLPAGAAPRADAVLGCVVHSATPMTGEFACSHEGVNRLWLNGHWSQRDNFLTVPTDCPQRDERLGWMGDAQVFMRTATCNGDVAAFFTKWMQDVVDAQTPEGLFPDVAPRIPEHINFVGLDDLCGGAGWADAGVIVPWTMWRVYGDTRVVEKCWAAMTAWLDYLERTNPDHLRTRDLRNNYGDWLCIPTDTSFRTQSPMKNLLATAYWASDATKMAEMATALGRADDATRFGAMADAVRVAFQNEFCAGEGRLKVETQTAYLLALAFDLVPPDQRQAAAARLVELIRDNDWHLSTGFIGISFLNPILTQTGHVDVAYKLLLQDTYPSWLYPIKHGATTIWERWNGWTHEDGFFNPHMNSFNHYSLGSVGEWLFRYVAGIELDPAQPGFGRFVLQPHLGDGLDWARATQGTMHGPICSAWRREDDRFSWEVTIPANTSATVHIPTSDPATVNTDGLSVDATEPGFVRCQAPAGTYHFHSQIG